MDKSDSMWLLLFVLAGVLLPSLAYAHADMGEAGSFMHGLTHPIGGLDHVCAMLAVGLWAAQTAGRSMWAVPLTFVSVMALGGVLPMLGISLPFVEQGIALSVLLLGILIAASVRLPLWLGSAMVGLFALWHGHAHGTEMPELASGAGYVFGFVLATVTLHVIGIASGLGLQRLPVLSKVEGMRGRVVHAAGASIALCGIYLSVV